MVDTSGEDWTERRRRVAMAEGDETEGTRGHSVSERQTQSVRSGLRREGGLQSCNARVRSLSGEGVGREARSAEPGLEPECSDQ